MKKTVAIAPPQSRPLGIAYRPAQLSEAVLAAASEIGRKAATYVAQQPGLVVGSTFTISAQTAVPRDELVVALSREYSDEPDPGSPITFICTDGNQHTFFRNV